MEGDREFYDKRREPKCHIEKIEINGGDERGVMKAIPALQDAILETVNQDIANGGTTVQTIRTHV